jgi:hypothetical protein
VTYARPETRPRGECGQSRQSKDAILRRREEAATAEQLETIDIRATVYEAGGIRKGGKSQTSHGRSLPSSNEGGGREKKRHRLYKRVKWMTEPKNKREGIDTCVNPSQTYMLGMPHQAVYKKIFFTQDQSCKIEEKCRHLPNPWKKRIKPTQNQGPRNRPARRRRNSLLSLGAMRRQKRKRRPN